MPIIIIRFLECLQFYFVYSHLIVFSFLFHLAAPLSYSAKPNGMNGEKKGEKINEMVTQKIKENTTNENDDETTAFYIPRNRIQWTWNDSGFYFSLFCSFPFSFLITVFLIPWNTPSFTEMEHICTAIMCFWYATLTQFAYFLFILNSLLIYWHANICCCIHLVQWDSMSCTIYDNFHMHRIFTLFSFLSASYLLIIILATTNMRAQNFSFHQTNAYLNEKI